MVENQPQKIDPKELYAQLRYLQNMYTQQYEFVQDNLATYSIASSTIRKNIELIENAEKTKNSKILVNPEGGIYFEAQLKEISRIMVYVGAGYLVEKGLDDAKLFLKENEKKGEEVLKRLAMDKQKLETEMIEINYRMAALEEQLSQQQQ